MKRPTPMPGSEEARKRGCRCEVVVPNWMGLGMLVKPDPKCPIHSEKPKRKARRKT